MQTAEQIRSPEIKTPETPTHKYQAYTLQNFRQLPQIMRLSETQRFDIEVVGHVLPFKVSRYVIDELIDWERIPDDPLFVLNFPQRDMLLPHHFEQMAAALRQGDKQHIREVADGIRLQLNPHPSGQLEHNVPTLDGMRLHGIQHKYQETVLFFPSHGQTCHAYCSFCFRWPQFVGIEGLKFASSEIRSLIAYLERNPQVTDILVTGGDPLVMNADTLAAYIWPLLECDHPSLQTIRIGTKALSYWPYRFLSDPDSESLLKLFRIAQNYGKQLALMAHINHPRELQTKAVRQAIARIRETGVDIRTQAPLLRHINDDPALWSELWRDQVRLGCIPYYMFVMRDTGAQQFFSVPLVRAWEIFQEAYQNVSGLGRTVRGPVMSADPGKCQVLGIQEVHGEKVLLLEFLQGRNPDWSMRPFFAQYDEQAIWLSELKPAFGEKRFFFDV
ncbi:MAG: lysine 2,3-aminomutase [Anaerolineae bacterium]|nr:lysine 2,3-aminomutase [Anaerolineae bacterium]